MLTLYPGADRGRTQLSWLDSRHTFSFGDYRDPSRHNFRALRVINDDRIAAGGGFGSHPHRDMEIITYVMTGQLEHQDSMGHGEIIHAGEWQAMHAGTGLYHSEFNPSNDESVHLLQIWLFPDRKGYEPGYQQKRFDGPSSGPWRLIASRDGRDGSLVVHQDAQLLLAKLEAGQKVDYALPSSRGAFLQVATGAARVNGHSLVAGDGLAVEGEPNLAIEAKERGELLLFDLG
jgi:hypothetical protein